MSKNVFNTEHGANIFLVFLSEKKERSCFHLLVLTCSIGRDDIHICILLEVGNSGPELSWYHPATPLLIPGLQ